MTELLRTWILGLTGAAIFCAAATLLTPEGRVKTVVRLLCGAVMASALLLPLLRLQTDAYGLNLSRYRADALRTEGDAEKIRRSLDRRLIEENAEAYILDKAQALGADVQGASVMMEWSTEGFWVPAAAEICGAYCAPLSRLIEAELGIPVQAQSWGDADE